MKLSLNWLKTHIEINESIDNLCELLTDTGLEVEHCTEISEIKGGLEGILVGKVVDCWPHPNADRLKLTKIDVGTGEYLQIVCGAPNVAKDQKVAVAMIKSTLHPIEGEPFTIKKGKIRGELSEGMLCAGDELGINKSHDGIMVLDSNAKVGSPLASELNLEIDHQIEIGLTPNRGDAISHIGTARDIKAVTGRALLQKTIHPLNGKNESPIKVEIENTEDCLRYSGIYLKGIEIKESPEWIQKRLKSIDIKPMNNVVDITNFVLHDLGQPIHAFDAQRIKSSTLEVRKAKVGEKLITLDEIERTLKGHELLITNGEKPIALAGVLGGLNTAITDKTTEIFIESANFDPAVVRKTAKTEGLNTDASFRYERGCDPNLTLKALQSIVDLMIKYANAKPNYKAIDIYPKPATELEVELNCKWLNQFCGTQASTQEIETILGGLDIKTISKNGEVLQVKIPTYRTEVTRPVDLAEEFLRIYGYNNVPIPTKLSYSYAPTDNSNWKITHGVRNYLANNGFLEMMNNSQTSRTGDKDEVHVINPLSEDHSSMRTNLLQTAVQNLAYNINRKNKDLAFFEFGKTYSFINNRYIEKERLILIGSGNFIPKSWIDEEQKFDHFFLKKIIKGICNSLNIDNSTIYEKNIELLDSGLAKKHGIKTPVYYAELDWSKLLKKAKKSKFRLSPISQYPIVERDLSVVVERSVTYDKIEDINKKVCGKYLQKVELFDHYEGERIDKNHKALAMKYYLSDPTATMTDRKIDEIMDKLILTFEEQLNATIRR